MDLTDAGLRGADLSRLRSGMSRRWAALLVTGSLLLSIALGAVDGEDGDDDAIRPNQLFAISLPHAVLDPSRWRAVVDTVHDRLATPYGLRSAS